MIKEIKTDRFEGVALLIPDGKTDISVKDIVKMLNSMDSYHPDDRWIVFDKATELKNTHLEMILPDTFSGRRYSHFQDILKSMECYSVNPYGEEPKDIPDLGAFTQAIRKKHQQWKKAQETTGTWIILKKEANR